MKDWHRVLINIETKIFDAIQIIDQSELQIALVVDDDKKLIGTVTDGDVRRGILRGINLDKSVKEIVQTSPITVGSEKNHDEILMLMKDKVINQLPVVDKNGCVIDLKILSELIKEHPLENYVVLMAGGIGSRLSPLTDECPKPMIKVGDKPLLETILLSFIDQGFSKFYIAVNYLANQIKDYFGDGSKWNIEIKYLLEDKKLGTAGALSLIKERILNPLIVMNGDLLTKVNYRHLLDFHLEFRALATMCVREYGVQIPYGVVKISNNVIKEIDEKPLHKFFVNAGIYVLNPEVIKLIPDGQYYDMTTLFDFMIKEKVITTVFPVREYWIDIGHYNDYEKANHDYSKMF